MTMEMMTTMTTAMPSSSIMNGSFTKSTQLKYTPIDRPQLILKVQAGKREVGGQTEKQEIGGRCQWEVRAQTRKKPFSTPLTRPDIRNQSV